MSHDISAPQSADAAQRLPALRKKIRWICRLLRFAAPAFAAWVLYWLAVTWSDRSAINKGLGRMLQRDLSGIEPWQQVAGFGVEFVVWLFVAAACYSIWRLFKLYHSGEILTPGAAIWLRRMALYGIVAQILDIVTRPLLSVIATLHFPAGQRSRLVNVFLTSSDFALVLLLLALFALAHIQKSAAEIASKHEQFV
jgi:Protein of unknown function (DUF2975)